MPSLESLAQDNRILRNRLKAGIDNRKKPVDIPLWPLLYLGVKLLRHDEALEILAERGFGFEAGMLTRSMFEAAVNIMWIMKGDDLPSKLKRYSEYQFVASQKSRDYVKNWGILDVRFWQHLQNWRRINDAFPI